MNRTIRSSLLATLLAFATVPAAAGVFSPYSAVYEISRDGLVLGEARYTLSSTGADCFVFQGVAKPAGLANLLIGVTSEQSRFCVNAGKIQPQNYEITRDGGDKDDNFKLDFDWTKKLVRTDQQPERPIPEGGLDPMVLQLAVRNELKRRGSSVGGKPIHVTIVEYKEEKQYELAVAGEEEIKTSLGKLRAVRVERVNDRKRQLRFWLAPSLDYLPVRVERQKKDDPTFSMKLVSLPDSPAD